MFDISKYKIFYKELVIGSSLEALTYCYINKLPFIYTREIKPHPFDFFNDEKDFNWFNLDFDYKSFLLEPNNIIEKKVSKENLWNALFFHLGLSGLKMCSFECSSIKIENNLIKAYSPHARMIKIEYEKLTIFDDFNVSNFILKSIKRNDLTFKVYDKLKVDDGLGHPFFKNCFYKFNDDLIKELYFLGNEVLTISYIKENDLNNFDWSDINVRFKVKFLIKKLNINLNKDLEITSLLREQLPINKNTSYENENNISFVEDKYEELIKLWRII